MRLTEGLDAGPVCLSGRVKIGPEMTAGELHDALAPLGAELMVKALAALEEGQLSCRPQNDAAATYAPKLDPREMRINWRLPSRDVHDRIRGLSPYPGAWFEIERGGKRERIKVLRSAAAKGAGPAGTLLDDKLTIACGKGAVTADGGAARRKEADAGGRVLARGEAQDRDRARLSHAALQAHPRI